MFQGASQVNLDAKGRLAVPTRIRDPLTQGGTVKLVLTAHPEGCLLLYPAPAWEPVRTQVMAFPSLNRELSLWKRLLVGQGSYYEIWDRETWNRELESLRSGGGASLPPGMENFSL